jgi:hypothetical protein
MSADITIVADFRKKLLVENYIVKSMIQTGLSDRDPHSFL